MPAVRVSCPEAVMDAYVGRCVVDWRGGAWIGDEGGVLGEYEPGDE